MFLNVMVFLCILLRVLVDDASMVLLVFLLTLDRRLLLAEGFTAVTSHHLILPKLLLIHRLHHTRYRLPQLLHPLFDLRRVLIKLLL